MILVMSVHRVVRSITLGSVAGLYLVALALTMARFDAIVIIIYMRQIITLIVLHP